MHRLRLEMMLPRIREQVLGSATLPDLLLAVLLAACAAAVVAAEPEQKPADPVPAPAPENYGRHQFEDYQRDHWSYVPVQRPEAPEVSQSDWVKTPIDAFILRRLEDEGLAPNPPADRRTLLRRVYLDLIGLLPTPAEVDAFLADESPDALARVVDALLARPEYGERWGRHWLDAVRYAESNGYERDGAKPHAWRYRDWVIDAFNADKPFDQFLREQIAGDELANSDAGMQIATTFLRLGPWDDEPADPLVDRNDQLDDVVGTTTAVFMAQTLRCARCHDHKFEAFTQRDYTRVQAIFAPLKRPQDGRTDLDRMVGTDVELAQYRAAIADFDKRVADLKREVTAAEWGAIQRLASQGVLAQPAETAKNEAGKPAASPNNQVAASTGGPASSPEKKPAAAEPFPSDALNAFLTPPEKRSEEQQKSYRKFYDGLKSLFTPEEKSQIQALADKIEDAEATRPKELPRAYIWMEEGQQGPVTQIAMRGDPRQLGDGVAPGFPSVLVDAPPSAAAPTAHSTGRRKQFAEWLTTPAHPLTARVIVNRVWQHHFGDGIVGTENDFGVMGETPTHPELLDWLASEFVASGWRLKALHRLIILSSAYQMSSQPVAAAVEADPNDDLLWRYPPRRLEAEAIRDMVLATSGQLNLARGGTSVYPKVSAEVLATQSRPGTGWEESTVAERNRRSVYIFIKRTLLVPEMEVLDFPDTNSACEQRIVSTVAPQALTWFNGDFIVEQARHFADRLEREAGAAPADQVALAYRLALARPVTEVEQKEVLRFLSEHAAQIRAERSDATEEAARHEALAAFCRVLLNTNEFVYLR